MTREEIAIGLAKDPEFKKLAPERQQAVFDAAAQRAEATSPQQPAPSALARAFTPTDPNAALAKTEAGIANRPSSIQYLREVAANPQLAQQHPFRTGLAAMGAPMEAGESIPANILLAAQRFPQDVNRLPQQLWQGITGERPAEMGDVARASGVPALQATAPLIGMGAMSGVPGIKQFSKPAEAVIGIPDKIGKFIGKPFKPAVSKMLDPASNFASNKTFEIRKGATKYFRDLNAKYGDDIDKLSKDMKGVVPASDIVNPLRQRLQEVGLLDFNGNRTPMPLSDLTRTEQKLLDLYEDMATNPNMPSAIPFQDVLHKIRELRQTVRQTVKSGNQSVNRDERIIYGFLHDVANRAQANNQSLAAINSAYAKERNFLDAVNNKFQIWKGEYQTGRGEKTLGTYYDTDQGTRNLLHDIQDKMRIKLVKGAKALSAYRQLTERHLIGAGIGGTLGYQAGGAMGGAVGTAVGSGSALAAGRLFKNLVPSPGDLPPAIRAIVIKEVSKMMNK